MSRATAYRWFGDNDRLVGEVLVSTLVGSFSRAREAARGVGVDRVVDALNFQLIATIESSAMRTFIDRDPQKALVILTTREYPIQHTLVGLIEALLVDEESAGNLTVRVDANTLAYALTRMMEAFAYADVVAGRTSQPAEAAEAFRCLLT